jgi:hypothetical protein
MARSHQLIYALNAGGVDVASLARVDLEKMRLAGEHPVANWLPSVLGPMSIRPGFESRHRIYGDQPTRMIPFVRSSTVANILGVTASQVRVYDGTGVALLVAHSSSAVIDPTFATIAGSMAAGWYNDTPSGAGTNPTVTAGAGLTLVATRARYASVQQSISIAAGDRAKPHTIRIEVARGPVLFRVGTAADGQNLQAETALGTGTHKITVTPVAATIYIKLRVEERVARIVSSLTFEHTALGGAGELTLPAPWTGDLYDLAWDQSIDVLFVGDGAIQPRRIERRGSHSWSITTYETRNGPLRLPSTNKVTLTPSVYTGNGTLTANIDYFTPDHVGGLFELTHQRQAVTDELTSLGQASDYITVTGIYDASIASKDREYIYSMAVSGFTGEVSLERSTDAEALVWSPFAPYTTAFGATTMNDKQSNLRVHYRMRMTSYTAGYATVALSFKGGSRTGLCRVTSYVSPTVVNIEVIKPFFQQEATAQWREPDWTAARGWPKVPRFMDGRLWWFRGDQAYGSIVDDFDNYDDEVEGDSGPIVRSVGSGAAEGVRWALDLQRLIVGTTGYEASIRSDAFDAPLTPTAFTVRNLSTLGASRVPAVKVDRGAFFVQRNGQRLYELLVSQEAGDYASQDATRLLPTALRAGVRAMAVQRQPDTRIYIVLEDGTCVVLTYERDDKVVAFTTIERVSGAIEDVCVLPGTVQDDVFFVVRQNTTQRYIERLGAEAAQHSPATCTLLDGYKVIVGPVSTISGALQFAGQTVSVWADGASRAPVAIDGSGYGELGATYNRVVYGRAYPAIFKSVKLAYAAGLGTAVEQTKRVSHANLVLQDSCLDGLRIGRDAGHADLLPAYVDGAQRASSQFFAHYDQPLFPIPSDWSSDSRIFLSADSGYGPVAVQAIVLDVETNDGGGRSKGRNGE